MPIHEYECDKCGHKFEEISWKISTASDALKCPKCGHEVKRSVSSGVFTVNGYNSHNGYAGVMR